MRSYPHNLEQANDYLWLVIALLGKYALPATPSNYAVWYEYVANSHAQICENIDDILGEHHSITQDEINNLYQLYIIDYQSDNFQELLREFENILHRHFEDQHCSYQNANIAVVWERFKVYFKNADSTHEIARVLDKKLDISDSTFHSSTQVIRELRQELERTRLESKIDILTKLPNRRAFDEAFHYALLERHEHAEELCLLLLDIDHFKQINDQYGHLIGDKVLQHVATVLKKQIKGKDLAARLGGEEFVILLPNTEFTGATVLAENIRTSVSNFKFKKKATGETLPPITVSIGAACYRNNESFESLLERADRAMYDAKANGRNQVAHAI